MVGLWGWWERCFVGPIVGYGWVGTPEVTRPTRLGVVLQLYVLPC